MTSGVGLRLVMLGTGPFAVPTFQALLDSPHQVLGLVTRPDRPAHRREKTPINPMRAIATQRGVAVFEPDSINAADAASWLRQQQADLLMVCDYGQILSREALGAARLGGVNLHASLLPKYRGAAPINWAIYHGETETGVTVIHMTPQLDAGPCLLQHRTPIGPEETAPELEARLAVVGAAAVVEAIELLIRGKSLGITQDSALATKAPRLKKEDGLVDWSRSAHAIANQVRGFQPWPTTYTFWHPAEGEAVRLILQQVRFAESLDTTAAITGAPGTVLAAEDGRLIIACGQGALQIEAIQPAGKRSMTAAEFLRGHSLRAGDTFAG